MKLHLKYTWVLILQIILSGCEKDVKNVRLPPFEQKLVISSFISPVDSVSYIFVSSNRKIYGELGMDENTGNLSGTVSDGTSEVTLDTTRSGLKFTGIRMPIKYGMSYTLNIRSDKGLSASATCTVPMAHNFIVNVDTFSVEPPHIQENPYPRATRIILGINDIEGEENYYRLNVKYNGYSKRPGTGEPYKYSGTLLFEKEYLTDTGNDGKELSVRSISGMGNILASDSAFLEVYLYNLEKSYFLYHRSLANYGSEENPFSEISPVFSNVKGGLGIFTSYTVDTIKFRLK